MEHKTVGELQRLGRTTPIRAQGRTMSRRARLEQWAAILDGLGQRRLSPLRRVESVPRQLRATLRMDDSPLTAAFEDPVLRQEGLVSDRLGDAASFFELSSRQAHYLVCDCYYQGTMTAQRVASRIRTILPPMTWSARWARAGRACVQWLWD